jgi:hypothetical protein
MAIFRGVGGSGESSDNSFLQEVTAQANSASASASAAQASATSAANSLAAIQDTEITSASFDTSDGVLTLTKTGGATVTADLDGRFLTSYTETNDLSTAVTWANVPDANITESSVTQYLTAANVTSPLTGGTGISIASNGTITNDSPDQTVALTGAGGTSVTGTYPNFTITSSSTLTDAQIKTAYENNADTNAFTDADHTKLDGIDTSIYLTTHQDISGKANLSGADFTGDVSVAGTFNTDGIESTIDSVDYPVYSTSLDGSNAIATLGGTATGNKVHTLEMRPAAGGVRMHWHQSGLHGGTPPPSGQTLRFHTTDRGIHVGDDLVGTYTAGDNQNNADVDFGMLVGRSSTNIGSNNFGFGYNINFNSATISSCAGIGSSIYINPTTNNSIGIGGDVFVGTTGTETPEQQGIFAGGNVVSGRGNYSFSWGKGDYEGATRYAAVNLGKGCVMFGQQINIDADSSWSLVGGTLNEQSYIKTYAENAHHSIAWGRSVRLDDSIGAVTFGDDNYTTGGNHSAAIGSGHNIYAQGAFLGGVNNTAYADARYAAAFGYFNRCEGEGSFAAGKSNNSLGHSGACIGQGLKTPLFLSNGDYVWDDYSVVVGGYNDEAHKYYTNTLNTAWVEDHRFVVGTGTSANAKDNGFIVAVPDSGFSGIIMPNLASSPDYASASAAKAGGVPVGGLYRIGSDVKILLSTD